MNKKIDLNSNMDSLDDFDLDFGDEYLTEGKSKKDRKPINSIASGAIKAFNAKNNGASFLKRVAFAALPRAYTQAYDEIVNVKDDITSIYDKSVNQFQPGIAVLKRTSKKALPYTNKFLPKGIANKLKQFSTEDESNRSYSSNYDPDSSEIKSTMQTIFGAQQIADGISEQRDDIHRNIDREISKKQFGYTSKINKSMAINIAKIAGYQNTILDQYYRKSLELQYKQYFTTRDLLAFTKANSSEVLSHLDAITKNTALPNEVKVSQSEQFANANTSRLIGYVQSRASNRLSAITKRLRDGLTREANNFAGSFSSNLESAESMMGMASMGMDPFEFGAEQLAGSIRDSIGTKAGEKLKGKLPKYLGYIHPELNGYIEKGGHHLNKWLTNYPGMLNRKLRDSNGSGFWGAIDTLIGHSTSTGETVNKNLQMDATAATSWNLLDHRTLIEIIPGYLSRSLEQLTNTYNLLAGNNEKTERQVYSTKRETFVGHSTAVKDARKWAKYSIDAGMKRHINEIVDYVDPDKTLSIAERIDLSLMLARDAAQNVDFDPSQYSDWVELSNKGMDSIKADKIADLFTTAFGVTTTAKFGENVKHKIGTSKEIVAAHDRLSTSFSRIRSGMGDFTNILNTHNATGEKDTLSSLGLINPNTGRVDPEYRFRLIKELLGKEDPYSFYTDEDTEAPTGQASTGSKFDGIRKSENKAASTEFNLDPLLNKFDTLTSAINSTLGKIKEANNTDQLDTLIAITTAHAQTNSDMLNRIAIGIENIKYVSGGGAASSSDAGTTSGIPHGSNKPRSFFGHMQQLGIDIFKGGKNLYKLNRKVRKAVTPIRNTLFSAMGQGFKPAVKMGLGAAKMGFDGAMGLGKVGLEQLFNILGKTPSRMARGASGLLSIGNALKDPIGALLSNALGLGRWGLGKGIDLATSIPGRAIRGIGMGGDLAGSILHGGASLLSKALNWGLGNKITEDLYTKGNLITPIISAAKLMAGEYYDRLTGKQIKSFKDIKGEIVDKTGKILVSAENFLQGFVNLKGKPYRQVFNDAYKNLERLFPDSFKPHSFNIKTTVGLFKDKFNLFKDKFLGSKLGANLSSPMGYMNALMENVVPTFASMIGKLGKPLDSIYNYLKQAFPLQSEVDKEANRVGGVSELIRRRTSNKKTGTVTPATTKDTSSTGSTLGTTGAPNIAEEKDDGTLSKLAEGAGIAGLAGAALSKVTSIGSSALSAIKAVAGLGTVAEGAEATGALAVAAEIGGGAAILVNPLVWAAVGAGIAYGGYKAYQMAARRSKLKPLEMLRYLQYGVPVDNQNAVVTIRYFEENIAGYISLQKDGQPIVTLKAKEVWSKFGKDFGGTEDNVYDAKNFSSWFYNRFLPVYVKHLMAVQGLSSVNLKDADDKLTNDIKYLMVNSVQFGPNDAAVGLHPLDVTASPWKDIALSDNSDRIKALSEQIKNLANKGEDVTLKNLSTIRPTLPILAPKSITKDGKLPPNYDKDITNTANKIADTDMSFRERVIDWTSRNIIETGARVITKGTQVAKESYAKAVDWTSRNVIEPVANSLAGLIRGAESGKEGYNAYNRGTMGNKILGPLGHRDLTKMTIAEIMSDMSRAPGDPLRLFAVGKYQMIPSTLSGGVKALGLDPATTLYDEKTQELLFSGYLLDKKRKDISAYIKGKSDDPNAAMSAAASEWASIADPATGASKYGNGNKASVTPDQLSAAMLKSRALYKQYIAMGMSEDDAYQKAVASDGSDLKADALAANSTANTSSAAPAPIGTSGTTTNASIASNTSGSIGKLAVPNPFAAAKTAATQGTTVATADTDPLAVPDTSMPILDSSGSSTPPDLSHISKATLQVGSDAAAQRNMQLTEMMKQTDLLSKLVNTGGVNTTASNNQITTALNTPPQTVQPVINLNRTI